MAGLSASGQSADWSITHLDITHFQSDRGGPFGFRTIGRLVRQLSHFDPPLRSPTPTNHFQSDRGGPSGFRTIGRLGSQCTSITTSLDHLNRPASITHFQPDRGGPSGFRTIGRLGSQCTSISPTSSLTVAGFGFRTIGRLVNHPPRSPTLSPPPINHLDKPLPV